MAEGTFDDPVLGRLVYDKELNWWEANVKLRPSLRVKLSLLSRTDLPPKAGLDECRRRGIAYLEWARRSEPTIRQRIADELLNVYNEDWTDDDAGMRKVTRDEFLKRIGPNSITLETDGESAWYYQDDDLFAGHWIEVRLRANKDIFQVGLAG